MTFNPAEVHKLIRFAMTRTGKPDYDEDLAQEAMLRALAAFQRTKHVKNPRAFLSKIVLDTVRDHWRRRRTWEDIESIDERHFAQPPNFENDMDDLKRTESLREALSRLDPEKSAIITLFYQNGLSISQIAAHQSKSVSAVKMGLLRARRELKEIIRAIRAIGGHNSIISRELCEFREQI